MRPLTLRRLFLQCSLLAAILFVVVVVALKLGAFAVEVDYALLHPRSSSVAVELRAAHTEHGALPLM